MSKVLFTTAMIIGLAIGSIGAEAKKHMKHGHGHGHHHAHGKTCGTALTPPCA